MTKADKEEWAVRNRLVVLYPRMSRRGRASLQQKLACWDVYGQTGQEFDERSAAQMQAVMGMVDELLLRDGASDG